MKDQTKRRLLRVAAIGAVVGALALAVPLSGLLPLSASSGHWSITAWFLHFTMHRWAWTQSLMAPPSPDLDDPGLILRGGGHYAGGCAFCHGAPGRRMPPIPAAATPHPPRLDHPVRELSSDQLFVIVKHGIKLTGMPAWPALARDDEVWAVVAFLRRLPGLDAAGYRALTHVDVPRDAEAPPVVTRLCARCHGVDGMPQRGDAFPRLAGQKEAYLLASLQAYARGARASGIMQPVAVEITEEEMREAARHYARLPPMVPAADAAPVDATSLGARIAQRGLPEDDLPACVDCHGPAPDGDAEPRKEVYPRLAGQVAWYLESQLRLFQAGARGGTPYAELMHEVAAHELNEEQIRAVAAYFASLDVPP